MDFKNMNLEDQQTRHSEMCATAGDLGLELPKDLTIEFDTTTAGADICERVHALIQEGIKRQEIEKERKAAKNKKAGETKKGSTTNKKTLASGEGKAQADGAVVPPPPEKKETKTPQQKMAEQKAARLAKEAERKPEGEAVVAKKAVTKKAVKKGAAKKAVAKKAAAGNGGAKRTKFEDDAKVTWTTGKENPARKDTARWERYEKLRKASGKTVKAVIAAGVPSATLINAKSAGIIKIN